MSRGPTSPRAAPATEGCFLPDMPLSRAQTEEIVGPIGEACWLRFGEAFDAFTIAMSDLDGSSVAEWRKAQAETVRDLEKALDLLSTADERRCRFLREATALYREQEPQAPRAEALLSEAFNLTLHALMLSERAKPREQAVESAASLRAALVRRMAAALAECGVGWRLSDGRELEHLNFGEGPADADLTPFERLVCAMSVHDADTPAAAARWVRRAMGQN